MEERRTLKRHELGYVLNIYDMEHDTLLGELADINTDGIMLHSLSEMPIKQEYVLEIRLCSKEAALFYDDGRDKKIRFAARSLWCRPAPPCPDGSPRYHTGFKLIDTTPAALLSISYMIRKFQKTRAAEAAAGCAQAGG